MATTLLADLRSGGKGGVLPWRCWSRAVSRAWPANLAVAEPTLIGRVIAAWPSFALTANAGFGHRKCGAGPVTILASTPAARHTPIANDPGGRHAQATITVS
jgi:hypothetical protein